VEFLSKKAGEEVMDLVFVDCLGTHFSSSIKDMTSCTKRPGNPFLLWLSDEGMAQGLRGRQSQVYVPRSYVPLIDKQILVLATLGMWGHERGAGSQGVPPSRNDHSLEAKSAPDHSFLKRST
jgi:hypothetical protein